jgi:LPS sulfotransferase NodH
LNITQFLKDPHTERLLQEFNGRLAPFERDLIASFTVPKHPPCFILGAPRCGSTLLHQMLARTGSFGYITNFVARHYMAPYLASTQQQEIFRFQNSKPIEFHSRYGRTTGWNQPHEFSYFWDRWVIRQAGREPEEVKLLIQEIASLENIFDKPMLFRNLHLIRHLPWLKHIFPKARFVILLRDPFYQAQSILKARQDIYGSFKNWFSIKPFEYNEICDSHFTLQAVAQIYYLLRTISEGSVRKNTMVVRLEDLWSEPRLVLENIISHLQNKPVDAQQTTKLANSFPRFFKCYNTNKISDVHILRRLVHYCLEFFSINQSLEQVVYPQYMRTYLW